MRQLFYITCLVSTLFFSGCTPAYIPSVINSPLMHNQGQTQFRASSGTSGYDVQGALALTDQLACMVNGSFVNRTTDSSNFRRHNYIEGALGMYHTFGDVGRMEVYTGYGYGETEGLYNNALWGSYNEAVYNKIFIQPSIGVSTGFVDFSFIPRIAFVNLAKKGQQGISAYKPFFEPAFDFKFGYEFFKMFMQFGFAIPISDSPGFNYQFFQFAVGMQLDLFNKSYLTTSFTE